MGMFDSVIFNCPSCERGIEIQSKAGECNLRNFSNHAVPVEIAVDIDGRSAWCENCNRSFTIKAIEPVYEIDMELV